MSSPVNMARKREEEKRIKMRKIVDRLKLHKRRSLLLCLSIKVWWQNCIFRAQNKHFSPQVCIFRLMLEERRNFRLNYLSIIELHLKLCVCVCVSVCFCVFWGSKGIYITISKVSYHEFYGIEMWRCAFCTQKCMR